MTPAAVILAAGASTRLGTPKQLVKIDGETLLDRAVRTAREAGCSPIVVVLGASAHQIEESCHLDETVLLVNDLWNEGMGSSLRLGITAIRDLEAAVVLTCDQPAVTPFHLRALMASGSLTASRYAGRAGVPAFFPATHFPALMALQGDAGARTLLQSAPTVDLPGGDLDVDTPGDLLQLHRTFAP
jgi:molybdenum cofactor cytidylyltransferase